MTTLVSVTHPKELDLPHGWKSVAVGKVCIVIAGQSPPGSTYRKEPCGLPFFQGKADFGQNHPTPRTWCVQPTKIAEPNDILISVRAPVGPTNVADQRCCIGRGLAAIRCSGEIIPGFLHAALRIQEAHLAKMGSGSTFEAINREILEELLIPLPPLPEQKRIVAALQEQMAAVERARASAEARLKAAEALPDAYKRGVFEGASASDWPVEKLGEASEVVGGIQKTPDRAPHSNSRPYLTVRNVQRGALDLSQVEHFEVSPKEVSRLRLLDGDILIVEGNGSIDHIGRNALFVDDGQEWIHQNHIIRVRLDRARLLPEFVSLFLNSEAGRAQMVEKARTSSGLFTLSAGKVKSLEVPAPDIDTQRRVTLALQKVCANAARVVEAAKAELEAINAMPAALLRKAFAGGNR